MLQTAVRVVESPSPLLVIVSLSSARQDRQESSVLACPLNVKSQSSKSLPGAYGSGFPTLMSSGRFSTPTVPLFSQLPRVPTLLRSSQCLTTVDAFQSSVQ